MITYVGEFAEGKYITFRNLGALKDGALTNMHGVWAKTDLHQETLLGRIFWFGRWRKYVFEAAPHMVFDSGCLNEIGEYCDHETKKQVAAAKARKKAEDKAKWEKIKAERHYIYVSCQTDGCRFRWKQVETECVGPRPCRKCGGYETVETEVGTRKP